MDELNKWEEIISSKFDEPGFPFDEENWEKAEAMLDKRLRREKFRKVFLIYFSGLITGLLLMFVGLRFFSGENVKQTQSAPIASNEPAVKNDANNAQPSSSGSSFNSGVNNDNTTRAYGHPVQANDSYVQNDNSNTSSQHSMSADASNSAQPSGKATVNPDNSNSQHTSNTQSAQQDHNDANASTNDVASHTGTSSNDSHSSQTGTSTDVSHDVNAQTSAVANASNVIAQIKDVDVQASSEMNSNGTDVPSDVPVKADVDSAFAAKVDSMYAKRSGFSIETGSNFNMGWKYSDTVSEGRGFNPVAGIAYTAHFGPDWTMRTSVRYENYRHFKVSRFESVDADPGFGKNNIDTTIIPHSLHYINVPVTFERRLSPRSFIGFGATYAYLFTTKSRTEVWRDKSEDDLEVITPGTAYGYMHGFKTWDLQLNIAYQYQLSSHFGMRLEGSYGLHEFKNNTLYASPANKMDRVFALRFMLTYNFGKQ